MPHYITLTGHRDVDENVTRQLINDALAMKINEWGGAGYLRARWGGAAGADTIFAECCIAHAIPMDLYLPDPFYEKRSIKPPWRERFKWCKANSVHIYHAAEDNNWKNNLARNEMMMSAANTIYAAYYHDDIYKYTKDFRPRKGGTSHGIQTALKLGYHLGVNLIHLPTQKAGAAPIPEAF